MKTELKYLNKPNLFSNNSKLIKIDKDEKGTYAIFDSTIFYPQGGGQESDKGFIVIDGKKTDIYLVLSNDNIIKHYGDFNQLNLKDVKVEQYIDENVRKINSKSHTAGHLVAVVIEKLYNIKATKAYHFLTGPYVEFQSNTNIDIDKVNKVLKDEISSKKNVEIKYMTKEELLKQDIAIPSFLENDIRVMIIDGYKPIPCGGTHLNSLSELNEVSIKKTKLKKDKLKVSYSFL